MKTTALSHGAATIVCAFATGKGAAFGLDFETKASVRLREDGKINAKIMGHPHESTLLLESCVKRVMERFRMPYGADIITESNIPIAAGLKSSSTAANAACLALYAAVARERGKMVEGDRRQKIFVGSKEVDALSIIKTGIKAAFDAKVTVTGAFDDASASYFGGYTVTDNKKQEIKARGRMDDLNALIFLPKGRVYSGDVDVKKLKRIAKEVDVAWKEALQGKIFRAMTTNGLLHSLAFKQNPEITLAALKAGALACGLSGTGPAVVALTYGRAGEIKDAWQAFEGKILTAKTNNSEARVLT